MSRRILVVEDEEAILKSLDGVLRDEGFEVTLVGSAEEALDLKELEIEAPEGA